ncbi:MAG: hypothetical protein P4N59_09950 [Negativicutes bacterium]|nr:hypothetical protein [Negativicutes bacterium]
MHTYEPEELERRLRFIDDIKLTLLKPTLRTATAANTLPSAVSENAALVLNDGIMGLEQGLSDANLIDVMDSTLLAQLWASEQYNQHTHFVMWYPLYLDNLKQMGWVTQASDSEIWFGYETTPSETVGLNVLERVGGRAARQLMEQSKVGLSQTPAAFNLFLQRSRRELSVSFKMMPCSQSVDGHITMTVTAVRTGTGYASKHLAMLGILPVHNEAHRLILRKGAYEEFRAPVREKLSNITHQLFESIRL